MQQKFGLAAPDTDTIANAAPIAVPHVVNQPLGLSLMWPTGVVPHLSSRLPKPVKAMCPQTGAHGSVEHQKVLVGLDLLCPCHSTDLSGGTNELACHGPTMDKMGPHA